MKNNSLVVAGVAFVLIVFIFVSVFGFGFGAMMAPPTPNTLPATEVPLQEAN